MLIDLCFNFLASLQSQREMESASGSSSELSSHHAQLSWRMLCELRLMASEVLRRACTLTTHDAWRKDSPAAVVQHGLELRYHSKDKKRQNTFQSCVVKVHARRRTSEAIRRDSHNILQERQPKSWPRPATHSSRCWHKISRCHKSSVDAEYVKDEVDRHPTVWSITSCSSDVTDNTCTRGYTKWTFSARQVRNDFNFILFDFPKTYAGGGQVTKIYFFFTYLAPAWHVYTFIVQCVGGIFQTLGCLYGTVQTIWTATGNIRWLTWHVKHACTHALPPPPPSPHTHTHTHAHKLVRFQIAKFTFRLSVVWDEECMETEIECTKIGIFYFGNIRMPCVLKSSELCQKGNDLKKVMTYWLKCLCWMLLIDAETRVTNSSTTSLLSMWCITQRWVSHAYLMTSLSCVNDITAM